MLTFSKLVTTISLALAASAAVTSFVPPASQGIWNDPANILDPNASYTDSQTIADTVAIVDQKATADGTPDEPIQPTVVTAVDGQLTAEGQQGSGTVSNNTQVSTQRRSVDNKYQVVFSGTGTGPNDRDGSIQGTAYLTYTLVNNATYNVADCLAFCDGIPQCVFVNLYYEYNNPGLDREFSNLKCAAYGDTHTAAEKTNRGGQQQAPPPAGLTYIQQSSGYSARTLVDPVAPEGYELVFGPTGGANNAPGYMGFAFLDRYDVDACAWECNHRGADGQGGTCQYFNIWRAVVNGNPTTYTCSMYYIIADESSAVNTGQGDLKVTFSRGYARKNLVLDGGFEGFTGCGDFCYTQSYSKWVGTSPAGGSEDATIFHYQPYAHSGQSTGALGSARNVDTLPGTLTPAAPLQTVAGKNYQINFFHASAFSGPVLQAGAFVDILWNGKVVSTITPGFENWKFYSFQVTAAGNDLLAFRGGKAPAYSFIDDVAVFQV